MNISTLGEAEVTRLGNALLSKVFELSIPTIRAVAMSAGIDGSKIPAESEAKGGAGSRAEVVPATSRLFGEMPFEARFRALPILAERLMTSKQAESVTRLLEQHGFQFWEGAFVPVGFLDERESRHLPRPAYQEIGSAFDRLSRGDDSGAITRACGALESLATAISEKNGWNDLPPSFQAKMGTVLSRLSVTEKLQSGLVEAGMKPADAEDVALHTGKATGQALLALQVLRRAAGDVHGEKPASRRMAYDAIKWASAICGLLEEELPRDVL